MNCSRHRERNAVNTCGVCGEWLCPECSIEKDGQIFCARCLYERAGYGHSYEKAGRGHYTPYPAPEARYTEVRAGNPLLHALLSFVFPGINFMYMGMMKRGLVYVCGLIACIMLGRFSEMFIAVGGPLLYICSFFDGYNTRRKVKAGIPVEDRTEDIIGFLKKHSVLLIAASLVIVASDFRFMFFRHNGLSLIVVFALVWFLLVPKIRGHRVRRFSEHGHHMHDNHHGPGHDGFNQQK